MACKAEDYVETQILQKEEKVLGLGGDTEDG